MSTRVYRFHFERKEHRMELNILNEVAMPATPDHRPTASTLRRSLRRSHACQQPHLAGQTHRLATASAGRRRPLPTRTPTRYRTGSRRRPATQCTQQQTHHRHTRTRQYPDADQRPHTAQSASTAAGHDPHTSLQGPATACASAYRRLRLCRHRLSLPHAVAKAITGTHCNGYHFFRNTLNNKETR